MYLTALIQILIHLISVLQTAVIFNMLNVSLKWALCSCRGYMLNYQFICWESSLQSHYLFINCVCVYSEFLFILIIYPEFWHQWHLCLVCCIPGAFGWKIIHRDQSVSWESCSAVVQGKCSHTLSSSSREKHAEYISFYSYLISAFLWHLSCLCAF